MTLIGSRFKVEIRTTCKACSVSLAGLYRARTYCGSVCRNKTFNIAYRAKQSAWQRTRDDLRSATASPNKLQCIICKRWYTQLAGHAIQRHRINAREYKVLAGLDSKRGVVPTWYRELKADICKENGTALSGKTGVASRFQPGDKTLGRYTRSPQTVSRLKKQGQLIGAKYGRKKMEKKT